VRGRYRHVGTVRGVRAVPVATTPSRGTLYVSRPDPRPVLMSQPSWARAVRRFARLAVWTLPVYAVLLGALTLVRVPDPKADFPGYAAYVTTGHFRVAHFAALVAVWVGLLGLLALTLLLAGTPGGGAATGGLLAGLGAAVLSLPLRGLDAFARPAIGWSYLRGEMAPAVAINDGVSGSVTAVIGALAVALGTLAWLLTGQAVRRCGVLNPADGVLLMLAAPLLGLGGVFLGLLTTIGALLLLAGVLGVTWTVSRLVEVN
jgi:hypothetical protein